MTKRKPEKTGRKQDGTFAPGTSGNPDGKPKGTRSYLARALDEIADAEAAAVLRKVITTAKGGDMGAAKLIFDRVWPVPKGRPVEVALPAIDTVADIVKAMGAIAAAVTEGRISSDEARDLAAMVEAVRKAHDLAEIERRLDTLERGKSHAQTNRPTGEARGTERAGASPAHRADGSRPDRN